MSVSKSSLALEIQCPAENHNKNSAAHHCCASFCPLKVPYFSELNLAHISQSSLALIKRDKSEKAVARIQTLFRPPIA
ncbi:hypothetical protein [Vibrio hepatarius]|uniref:hypothetical protein n=1 Tax=Vibrio hepatarius TaxID=171383 RepID=UPI001C095C32|nr:hypothetical protein [Vibrio hepatarius]MBU2897069.1 hypothetical protein [Vibrio hepatarius]